MASAVLKSTVAVILVAPTLVTVNIATPSFSLTVISLMLKLGGVSSSSIVALPCLLLIVVLVGLSKLILKFSFSS